MDSTYAASAWVFSSVKLDRLLGGLRALHLHRHAAVDLELDRERTNAMKHGASRRDASRSMPWQVAQFAWNSFSPSSTLAVMGAGLIGGGDNERLMLLRRFRRSSGVRPIEILLRAAATTSRATLRFLRAMTVRLLRFF